MRRLLALLLALVSVFVIASCGGDDDDDGGSASASGSGSGSGSVAEEDDALTTDEFIERGDAICAELEVAVGLVEPPADEAAYGDYIREIIPLAEQARDDMAALVPPAEGESVHQALLDAIETSIDTAAGAADAADRGDTVTAGDLLAQADAEGDAADAEAQAYGFVKCGKEDDAG